LRPCSWTRAGATPIDRVSRCGTSFGMRGSMLGRILLWRIHLVRDGLGWLVLWRRCTGIVLGRMAGALRRRLRPCGAGVVCWSTQRVRRRGASSVCPFPRMVADGLGRTMLVVRPAACGRGGMGIGRKSLPGCTRTGWTFLRCGGVGLGRRQLWCPTRIATRTHAQGSASVLLRQRLWSFATCFCRLRERRGGNHDT